MRFEIETHEDVLADPEFRIAELEGQKMAIDRKVDSLISGQVGLTLADRAKLTH